MITKGEMTKHHNSFRLSIWMFPQTILDALGDSPAQFEPIPRNPAKGICSDEILHLVQLPKAAQLIPSDANMSNSAFIFQRSELDTTEFFFSLATSDRANS